ncbi:uncharacterized protein LOC113296643 [Papaver somniferum]|uniref:uncharacterized protein LOC113296643 n=1 Tax=Papaver somniferum TaxID=3469 RepID=UPI000E6F89BE|nr:uncharacterized protein LOC113296643 [Papaver somniferum]
MRDFDLFSDADGNEVDKVIEKLKEVGIASGSVDGVVLTTSKEETTEELRRKKKRRPRKELKRLPKFLFSFLQMRKIVFDIVETSTGSAAGPIISHAGKQILDIVPGEVLLDSFSAYSKLGYGCS